MNTSKQKRRDKRCAPRLRELLERWQELDEQARVAREAQMRAIEAKWDADQRLHEIELQQRWCVLDALRFFDMTDYEMCHDDYGYRQNQDAC